jgi:hypothetical protein
MLAQLGVFFRATQQEYLPVLTSENGGFLHIIGKCCFPLFSIALSAPAQT